MDSDKQQDGYGRLIAGIRVGDVDLSLALVERGLGHVFIIPPESLDIGPLLAAQAKARQSRRGFGPHHGIAVRFTSPPFTPMHPATTART